MTNRAIALLVIVTAGACSRTPAPEAGQLRVTPLEGSVSLVDGGETMHVDEATTVDDGVSILTEPGARAKIDFPGERSLELAPQTEVLVDGSTSEVAWGSVLVRTSSPVTLEAGGSEFEATEGIFRIDRRYSVLLATYAGSATVLGSGVPPVPALWQASVLQGGEITGGVVPLEVRENDPWDAQLLGSAIDLGLQLLSYESGLDRQLPSGREASAVSRMLERDFPPSAIKAAISQLGDAASAVVAAVVAQEAARLVDGSSKRILQQILELQSYGASWIVIVAELGLPAAAALLTEKLREIADSISEVVTPPPAPALASTTPSNATSPTGPGAGSQSGANTGGSSGQNPPRGGGSAGDQPGGSTTQPPDPPPAEDNAQENSQPPPPPPQGCTNAVECTVDDILDNPPRSDLPI